MHLGFLRKPFMNINIAIVPNLIIFVILHNLLLSQIDMEHIQNLLQE
jgi:hypothetical protein